MKKLVFVLITALPALLFAHGMDVEIDVDEKGIATGRAVYHGDAPVVGARVMVRNADGEELLKVKTDEEGRFEFEVPCRGDLSILVRHGSHQGKAVITKDEIPTSVPEC